MSKASETALGLLHGAVATALTDAVKGTVTEDGVPIPASASHIMAAITFLKNNNITADAESNAALAGLAERLKTQRKDSKAKLLSNADLDAAAAVFERDLGPGALQ